MMEVTRLEKGLNKRRLSILAHCNRVVDHYLTVPVKPEGITLYPRDYKALCDLAAENGVEVGTLTHRGLPFKVAQI